MDRQIIDLIQEANDKSRGYASHFGWRPGRDLEEWGVLNCLIESLEKDEKNIFFASKVRGRGSDPPDCEALNSADERIAIEITELVDEEAIKHYKKGFKYDIACWDKKKFKDAIQNLLTNKNSKYSQLKEPPYDGGYVIVIYTDEPMLNRSTVEDFLRNFEFNDLLYVTQAFLLLSYDVGTKSYPYFELKLSM